MTTATEPDVLPVGVTDALSQFIIGQPIQNVGESSTLSDPDAWLKDILTDGTRTPAGVNMSPANAMKFAPVFYAVSKVAGHLSLMSTTVKEKLGERKTREATGVPAYRLTREPNHLYGNSVFVDTVSGHAVFRGNGRAYIDRDPFTLAPKRLLILPPDCTKTVLINGEKWHLAELVIDSFTQERRAYRIPDRDCLHIVGHSTDGIIGFDVYRMARDSIALGVGAERQQSYHLARNAVPGILLKAPKGVFKKPGEAMAFLTEFRGAHDGLDNQGKTALLNHGVDAEVLSHTGRDSQTLETRQFQREDMALFWCLETILGEDGNSYASEEQRTLAYLKGLPGKLKKRWEEERDRKLLTERQKRTGSHYHEMNAGGLLRADSKTTMDTLARGVQATIYSRNDARDILGLDAVEGGDEYVNPHTAGRQNNNAGNERAEAMRARLRDVIKTRLVDLAGVERKRVETYLEQNAQNGDVAKFNAWLDKFYEGFAATFGRVFDSLGADARFADTGAAVAGILSRHAEALRLAAGNLAAEPFTSIAAALDQFDNEPDNFAESFAAE